MKNHDGNEVKDSLGPSAVATSFMLLASLPIGDKLETRYGDITRTSLNDFKITIKRENELSEKYVERTKKNPIEEMLNANN